MKNILKPFSNTIPQTWLQRLFAAVILLGGSGTAEAQGLQGWEERFPFINDGSLMLLLSLGLILFVSIILLIVCLYILSFLKILTAPREAMSEQEARTTAEKREESFFEKWWPKLNQKFGAGQLVPIEQEKDIMLGHSYDGISELDNHMPPWLRYIFYVTIGFAVVYVLHYWILGTGTLQIEEYQQELAEAEEQAESRQLLTASAIDENNVVLISNVSTLEDAKAIYLQNCAACHGQEGEGTVGPNLTDEYWLHGGDIKDVFRVIKYGVQEKGMIPWEGKLDPEQMQNVASYILSLQGTTPAAPKEPQGEKYIQKEQANDRSEDEGQSLN